MGEKKLLGEILIENNFVTEENLKKALSKKKLLGEILLEENFIKEDDLKRALLIQQELLKEQGITKKEDITFQNCPIPYIIEPDQKLATICKMMIFPLIITFLARIFIEQEPQKIYLLISMLVMLVLADMYIIYAVSMERMIMFSRKIWHRKRRREIEYDDIVNIETDFFVSFKKIGYCINIYNKNKNKPLRVNIDFFDKKDLQVLLKYIEGKNPNVKFNVFSEELKNGNMKGLQKQFLKKGLLITLLFIGLIMFLIIKSLVIV